MKTVQRFIRDLRKYREYFFESTKAELKLDLTGTYLGYVWWILDPLMYMGVYVFLVQFVLRRGGPGYPIFIFSAILPYRWISRSWIQASNSIIDKKNIINQVYVPKFLLPLQKVVINTIYFIFSLAVLFLFSIFNPDFKLTLIAFHILPVIIVTFFFVLSISIWLSHIGTFIYDIEKLLNFLLRILFYVSPILFSIEDLPGKFGKYLRSNPLTPIFQSYRNVILFGQLPLYRSLALIMLFSLIVAAWGVQTLYRYDGIYSKTF